jgi:hypothetical protein
MALHDLLRGVASQYDRKKGFSSPPSSSLRWPLTRLSHAALWLCGQDKCGQGNAAIVPWIGIFDPGDNPQEGMHLVYLLDAESIEAMKARKALSVPPEKATTTDCMSASERAVERAWPASRSHYRWRSPRRSLLRS